MKPLRIRMARIRVPSRCSRMQQEAHDAAGRGPRELSHYRRPLLPAMNRYPTPGSVTMLPGLRRALAEGVLLPGLLGLHVAGGAGSEAY